MAVREPSSLSAEGFTLKTIPVPSPSVLLNLQLKRCKLRLGSSQDSSKAVRILPWQLLWLQLLLSTQREGNLGLLDGCPFKHQAAPPPAPGEFHWLRKSNTHTQKAQSLQVHLFPSHFSSFPHQRIKFLYFQQN